MSLTKDDGFDEDLECQPLHAACYLCRSEEVAQAAGITDEVRQLHLLSCQGKCS